ncbi:hypothetical protein MKX03_010964 [Papaver bracteatum]|nr:hypothetical protein MKX03_010964 [Papaver bracteatum]
MTTVTITLACKATLSFRNSNSELGDPSFSSYLSNAEEAFVLKPSEVSYKPATSRISSISQESMDQVNVGWKKSEDGEIEIFGAEKYFNGEMDVDKTRTIDNETTNLRRAPKPKYGTPSTCSELSSNSQNALLAIPSRLYRLKTTNNKNIFAAFGCKCYCSDKKSVDVDEIIGDNHSNVPRLFENKRFDSTTVNNNAFRKLPTKVQRLPIGFTQRIQTSPEWFKEELPSQKFDKLGLQFNKQDFLPLPNLNAGVKNVVNFGKGVKEEDINVFRSPPIFNKEENTLNLQSKLTLLNWGDIEMDDDTASDTRIDFGKIWSNYIQVLTYSILSAHGNHSFFTSSQESNDQSTCVSPTTCYEPSEASIEWSVATASAADLSVSFYSGEQKPVTETKTPRASTKNAARKEMQKRRPSSLVGCKSNKFVKVVTDAHRIPDRLNSGKPMQQKTDNFKTVPRFQAETAKVKESGSIGQQYSTLPRSARVSHSLYMK